MGTNTNEAGFYVAVRERGKKRAKLLQSDGALTAVRMRAVCYPDRASAEREVEHIMRNYSEQFDRASAIPAIPRNRGGSRKK